MTSVSVSFSNTPNFQWPAAPRANQGPRISQSDQQISNQPAQIETTCEWLRRVCCCCCRKNNGQNIQIRQQVQVQQRKASPQVAISSPPSEQKSPQARDSQNVTRCPSSEIFSPEPPVSSDNQNDTQENRSPNIVQTTFYLVVHSSTRHQEPSA